MWSPSFRRASPSPWRRWSPRKGTLGARTAAMTFAVLEVLTLRKPLSRALALTRPRTRSGLAVATLGGATLGLLRARLEQHLRRSSRRPRHWGPRAREALRDPMETALAAAMLGALALPLMVEPPREQALRKGTAPRPPPGPAARSIADDDDDWDDLDLEGAIASW